MKLIKPSIEFYGALSTDYENTLKFIEKAGRICYKSEDKITEISAEGFIKRLINSGHLAMVEHSNFVVRARNGHFVLYPSITGKYITTFSDDKYYYLAGSLRAWFEIAMSWGIKDQFKIFIDQYGKLFNTPKTIAEYEIGWCPGGNVWQVCPHDEIPKELHRYAIKFICDRGVSHELVRHRPCSFAQESTRYVNYAGKEMEFIEPAGFNEWPSKDQHFLIRYLDKAESEYDDMISYGFKPQQARAILPNALKTEIIVTADDQEWRHIRKLRTTKDAHPDMQLVMNMVPWEKIL
jgi:thymidylate synthase (FAD)